MNVATHHLSGKIQGFTPHTTFYAPLTAYGTSFTGMDTARNVRPSCPYCISGVCHFFMELFNNFSC
jgi:hypothetical protein